MKRPGVPLGQETGRGPLTRQKKTGAHEEWNTPCLRSTEKMQWEGEGTPVAGSSGKQVALEWGLEREISVKNGNRRAERKEVGRKGRGEAGPKCHNAVSGTTN